MTTASSFDPVETTVAEIHAAMADGILTARALVDRYLARIDAYDAELNAILTINGDARQCARDLDERFGGDGFVGPLHGIPVILKDNQDTRDLPTTAGSIALEGTTPARDAFLVEQLRAAGAIVIAKANLQEFSFGVDTISSLGGATRNAYDLDRRPSGSSGGTAAAIAANLGVIGTGSDTCSSVRSPPAFHALVGVRPTRGLVSRTGIIPLSETQDTAGPLARTVADAARLLEVMAGYDPADPVTATGHDRIPRDGYLAQLAEGSLQGARIGVARQFFGVQNEERTDPFRAGPVTEVLEGAIETMAAAGATIVDPVAVVEERALERTRVVHFEFARDLNAYLADRGEGVPYDSLQEIIDAGAIAPEVASRIREAGVLAVDPSSVDDDRAYLRRIGRRLRLRDAIISRLIEDDLDAFLYPPSTIPPVEIPDHQPFDEMICEPSAHTGLPAIVVPAGFTEDGLPVGLELLGRPFAEPRLFELAFSFEQVAAVRRPPERFGSLE